MKNKIEIGDTVRVSFHAARYTLCNRAKVLYVPQSSGDAWHFRDIDTTELHEVSEGCTVTSTTASLPPLILSAKFLAENR